MGVRHPHNPSEYPSLLLYVLDQTHVSLTLATAIVVLYSRDAHTVWFSIGALGSTILAKVAKRAIRQPRPPPPPESKQSHVRPKKTYGMPSTHATAFSFYLFYLAPLLPFVSTAVWTERAALCIMCALGFWSRVALGYHTWEQTVGGAAVGAVSAAIWSKAWDVIPNLDKTIQRVIDISWKMATTW